MKKKTITLVGVGVAGAALALSGTSALAGQQDAARGGGQILVGSEGGAGSTIAFTAEGTADAARGQVQYVDRSGEEQVVQHGTVGCIDVQGNIARIAGDVARRRHASGCTSRTTAMVMGRTSSR